MLRRAFLRLKWRCHPQVGFTYALRTRGGGEPLALNDTYVSCWRSCWCFPDVPLVYALFRLCARSVSRAKVTMGRELDVTWDIAMYRHDGSVTALWH